MKHQKRDGNNKVIQKGVDHLTECQAKACNGTHSAEGKNPYLQSMKSSAGILQERDQ